jgi:hypothetical protein
MFNQQGRGDFVESEFPDVILPPVKLLLPDSPIRLG